MQQWIIRQAIKVALRKPHPIRFAYGEDNDFVYFVIYPEKNNKKVRLVADELQGNNVCVLALPHGDVPEAIRTVTISDVASLDYRIERYYRGSTFEYSSCLEFLIHTIIKYPTIRQGIQKLHQWRFNRYAPNISGNKQVLQSLVDLRLSSARSDDLGAGRTGATSVFQLMEHIYGSRIYGHPQYHALAERLKMTLEAFTASGEVERSHDSFRASGRAVDTLAKMEEAELRHNENIMVNRRIAILTFVMALAAVLEIPLLSRLLNLD